MLLLTSACLLTPPTETTKVAATFFREMEAITHEASLKVIPIEAPVVPGFPAADKLLAFRLSKYQQVLVLDGDVLALQSMEALFDLGKADSISHFGGADNAFPIQAARPAPLVIAHHAYDMEQKRCGLPLVRRAVSALMSLRPQEYHFEALKAALASSSDRFSEQTALSCHFHNHSLLHTLPCSYLYDISVEEQAVPHVVKRCCRYRPCAFCQRVMKHVEADCLWRNTWRDVHATHFKGKWKPWYYADKCRPLRYGPLMLRMDEQQTSQHVRDRVRPTAPVDHGNDNLEWDHDLERCVSVLHGVPVGWSSGLAGGWWNATPLGDPVPKQCCSARTLLQAEGYSMQNCSTCKYGH